MDQDTNTWATILHLSVFAGYVVPLAGLVAPILIWQLKKNQLPGIDAHGRVVANFVVSMLIYGFVAGVLCFVVIGVPLLIVLGIVGVVFPLIGAIKASNGQVAVSADA